MTLDSSLFNGQSNQSAISASDNGISGVALAINQLAEFGSNLSKALFASGLPAGGCFAFPQERWESRSSGSTFTSNPEDIETETSTISNCGDVGLSKVSTKGGALAGASFALSNSSGTTVKTGTTVTSGTLCLSCVPAGTYTVKETAAPKGYDINTTTQSTTVGVGSTCTNNTLTFKDTPLTHISVSSSAEAAGATISTISCSGASLTARVDDDLARVRTRIEAKNSRGGPPRGGRRAWARCPGDSTRPPKHASCLLHLATRGDEDGAC